MQNRIVSFLPSATEILYELGVGDQVVGVTHECNFPVEAMAKPRVIHSSFDPQIMTSQEIDKTVVELMHSGKDIYILDEEILKKVKPNLIVAQGTCEVCSPYTREINRAVSILENKPDVLILDPHNLDDILQNIIEIGKKVSKEKEADSFISRLKKKIDYIKSKSKKTKPKVLCLEWLDPLFTAGHWIPQMIDVAGGINGISLTGEQSRRMDIDEAIKFGPDIVILMPCGFDVNRAILEYEKLATNLKWKSIVSMCRGICAVNANEFFSKPGPRTVTGLEILAKLIHPEIFSDLQTPKDSFKKIF